MDKKTIIILILVLILGIGLGLFFYWLFGSKDTKSEIIEPDITKELAIIDSLTVELDKKNQEILELQERIDNIKTSVTEKIEQIKILPLDTNIAMMKENLIKYGEITSREDMIKCIEIVNKLDTGAFITLGMVQDVNIISEKYSGELRTNSVLREEVHVAFDIIEIKDSLSINNEEILKKQMKAYKQNIDALEQQIKQEKKEKRKVAWILGTTTTVSLAITTLLLVK